MLSSETLTFLATDIEGSTELWERARGDMAGALRRHDEILRSAVEGGEGHVFKTVGDGMFAVFAAPARAVETGLAAQRALFAEPWDTPSPLRVRMALHAGDAEARDQDYFGPPVNRVARILDAGHGGQILLSQAVERLVSERFPEGVALRDLGLRRLKDLTEPERIFQLVVPDLPADFPPLRTLDVRPHNIPAQTTGLVGRDHEISAILALLRRPGVRLITLVGPGGTGKTRLALQAAAEAIDDFADGVFLVNLTTTSDFQRVPSAILRALGVRTEGEESEIEALVAHLTRREMLLVLDNFEQVLDAAPGVSELLGAAPRLTVLVTSQATLRIQGEHEVPVGPLALPDPRLGSEPERLLENEAVALFVDRARAARPSFELTRSNSLAVADLTRKLDGLPLAIELAAARIKLFPPEAMLQRLAVGYDVVGGGGRDRPDRQRTLRATMGWSYDLLSPDEQALFRRQAVFDGGYTLEAAEAVCSAPGAELDVLEGLSSLVDKSLVRQVEVAGEPRFERLRTIRSFAAERLVESGEEDMWRRRHAEYFAGYVERYETDRFGEGGVERAMQRLDREFENVRAAVRWALGKGEASLAARLCQVLPALWFRRGHIQDGRSWLEAVSRLEEKLDPRERASILNLMGRMGQMEGDNSPQVLERFERSLELFRELDDAPGIARALMNLGNARRRAEDLDGAERLFQESLEIYNGTDDPFGGVAARLNLGELANARGEVARARQLFEDARATSGANKIGLAYAMMYLGMVDLQEGLLDDAARRFDECEALFQRLGGRPGLAWIQYYRGWVAADRDELEAARAIFLETLRSFEELKHGPGIVGGLLALAYVACREGRADRAARLLGAAQAAYERARTSASPIETRAVERIVAECQGALGAEAFDAEIVAGNRLELAQALDLARAPLAEATRA